LADSLNFTGDFVNFTPTMATAPLNASNKTAVKAAIKSVIKAAPAVDPSARRKPKSPEINRARILAAATEAFASRGFEGASMDAISARTKTTRGLINYYFGSKEGLYLAVLERAYSDIREAENALRLDHLSPVDALRHIVEFTYDYYVANEHFVRLVVAENQAKGVHMKRSPALRSVNRPILDLLEQVIARGRTSGDFRVDIDAVDIHMAIAALGMFNVTNQHTFGTLFLRDMGAKGDVGRRRRMAADIILSWLSPPQAPARHH
jgi:AcrR family transcriptional regulator